MWDKEWVPPDPFYKKASKGKLIVFSFSHPSRSGIWARQNREADTFSRFFVA